MFLPKTWWQENNWVSGNLLNIQTVIGKVLSWSLDGLE
jgi:hypothetical protein